MLQRRSRGKDSKHIVAKMGSEEGCMNYLVVVAHPDDEVLGAGATIHKLIKQGHNVAIVTMANHAAARANISVTLADDQRKAMDILGVEKCYAANFPNIKMNTVPHLELVQFIEKCIVDFQAGAIITHHPSDTNIDHQETGRAALAACRLFQRTTGVPRFKELIFMEVPSSTEWSLNSAENRFIPNTWIEVDKEGVETKIKALNAYAGVMRPYPHPRSNEALEGLAAYRGAQAGVNYAEAFECVFRSL